MNTPVAFIIFNRPDLTQRVFAEIARAKPEKLFVVADGPRSDSPSDIEQCAAARAVIEQVDWDCEVFKNYSDVNLGCGKRPATGISWVFQQVDRAIILEDDCVPHPTFFRFCGELLQKYRNEERVVHISGNNFRLASGPMPFSYSFSFYNICFGGWATWQRAWRSYDFRMKRWPEFRDGNLLQNILGNRWAEEYWQRIFDRAYAVDGDADYWDYQWAFACWAQNGLAILPNTTLVSNIGFGKDGTHTTSSNNPLANLPTAEMVFPLRHPHSVAREKAADQVYIERFEREIRPPNFYERLHLKAYRVKKLLLKHFEEILSE